ncbi:MAG: hypothetical protein HY975_03105 [Candidatus Kerfeldbacteria bacterium]|nr:hypothetical protein [Candidatus Kerfeldbacteria bacterium]
MSVLKFSTTTTRLLALVADDPKMPSKEYSLLIERLEGDSAALAVAQHLAGEHQSTLDQLVSHPHRQYAAELRQYVRRNSRLYRVPTFRRK